jgi:hypothetical protein
MTSAIETKMDALEHELVALVCDTPAENVKLLEAATAGKIGPMPTEGNGLEHAKVLLTTLRWLRKEEKAKRGPGRPRKTTATAVAKPKRKPGRPKGSKNKPAAEAATDKPPKRKPGRPKGSKNKTRATASTEAAPKKRGPGRPKGSKNKPKTEPAPKKKATKAVKPRKRKGTKAAKNAKAE